MKKIFKEYILYLVGIILLVLVLTIFLVLTKMGQNYGKGLNNVANQNPITNITHIERKDIKSISLKKANESGCMVITPDGAVRIYKICDKEMQEAHRLTDAKRILEFYKLMAETDLQEITNSDDCDGYIATLNTDESERIVCIGSLSGSNGNNSPGDNPINIIGDTIKKIIEDLPMSTPTPIVPTGQLPSGTIIPGEPTPTIYGLIGFEPTPTPTGRPLVPFSCNFSGPSGNKKPTNISNIVCSSDPTPAP
jgi:hypothetical protein